MGHLTIVLDDDLGEKFEQTVLKRYGKKKGNKKRAATEAIVQWLDKNA